MKIDQQPPSRPRGRPRTFDEDAALDRAMRLFWQRGYATTSMSELIEAMGVSAPSIYAVFGDKQALFLRAVARYRSSFGDYARCVFENAGSTREAIAGLFDAAAQEMAADATPTGCMLALSAVNLAAGSDEVQQALLEMRRQSAQLVAERIARGVKEGDMPPDTDVGACADFVNTYLNGMSIQARDGWSADRMVAAARYALRAWPGA